MDDNKSLDVPLRIIAALLRDIQMSHGEVFGPRACRLTTAKVVKRYAREGIGFLTKTLPRLGKAFDRALTGEASFDAASHRFRPMTNSQLPMFMGELFGCIFSHDGRILPNPCVKCIKTIRQLLYLFYKYELPYDREQEQVVLSKFIRTEEDLRVCSWGMRRLQKAFLHPLEAQHTFADRQGGFSLPSDCSWCLWRNQCGDHHSKGDLTPVPTCLLASQVGTSRNHDQDKLRSAENSQSVGSPVCPYRRKSDGKPLLPGDHRRQQICNRKGCKTAVCLRSSPVQMTFQPWNAEWACLSSWRSSNRPLSDEETIKVVTRARRLLSRVFKRFDHEDIYPRHGPGAVSTKEQLWDKYSWSKISPRIITVYPLDAYFYASLGHVCDKLDEFENIKLVESSARVILVPKDSRGPRLISCEPLEHQWIQQGLGSAIVRHVERHPLTRYGVHFTDQSPNRCGALLGSKNGGYATLDLNEASDRVTTELVRLLFPEPLLSALLACRSLGTTLPSGKYIRLEKFAPMGSALCFPILALSIWALLVAGLSDADVFIDRIIYEGILVYGDDVVVPTAQAANAIKLLESFGLKVNRDKSCFSGFFRESCGADAYKGEDVTPVRFRTVWSSRRNPDAYTSWIAYANSMYARSCFNVYDLIVKELHLLYGEIPALDMNLSCPSLVEVPEVHRPKRRRSNSNLQKLEWNVWDVRPHKLKKEIDGWKMLLRYFAEAHSVPSPSLVNDVPRRCGVEEMSSQTAPFSVSSYTKRRASILVRAWR